MQRSDRADWAGPVLFSYGFRPFFLAAGLFATLAVPIWLAVWQGRVTLGGPFIPVDWHVHEMLFGYAAAVIAGFLFTAVPNWTGRMPARGWPLILLAGLWLCGRLAVAGLMGLGPVGVMVVDTGFLAAIAAMVAREIVAGRNWRNLKVVVPVLLLFAANLGFHVEAIQTGSADLARRFGFSVVLFLIMLIGGRIIPSFTRNWLAKREAARLPAPFGRFDGLCLATAGVAMLGWTLAPGRAAGAALILAAALHGIRLARWRGLSTWRDPLVLMLHLAYGFLPLGLAAMGLAGWGLMEPAAGFHLLGIGGIGGMTLAVMMRATMGHTGHPLAAGPALTAAFAALMLAAGLRALAAEAAIFGLSGLTLAATLWTLAFAGFAIRLGPWLAGPVAGRRRPNP